MDKQLQLRRKLLVTMAPIDALAHRSFAETSASERDSECRGRSARSTLVRAGWGSPQGRLLPSLALIVAVTALSGYLVLSAFADAGASEPVPGIRTVRWQRVRELPRPPGQPLDTMKRIAFRAARRYIGPPPSVPEFETYRASGDCDAFHSYLLQPWRTRVDQAVEGIEEVLDEVMDSCDLAIEDAKRRIRGTEDELLQVGGSREEQEDMRKKFLARASAAGDMCVSDSYGGVPRSYRIRRSRHPRVYELRRQDAEVNELRKRALHDEIAVLLEREGPRILDETAMQQAWSAILAGAAR